MRSACTAINFLSPARVAESAFNLEPQIGMATRNKAIRLRLSRSGVLWGGLSGAAASLEGSKSKGGPPWSGVSQIAAQAVKSDRKGTKLAGAQDVNKDTVATAFPVHPPLHRRQGWGHQARVAPGKSCYFPRKPLPGAAPHHIVPGAGYPPHASPNTGGHFSWST